MRLTSHTQALAVWGLAAAFYLFGFFQRVTPASLAGDLMRDFGLTAAALGNLSAFYFYAYAAMQLPTGVLVDRLGPSRLILVGAAAASAGAFLFAWAPNTVVASIGRGLVGGAHAMAWVSMLKLVANWFPPHRFGTMTGVSLGIGTLGAVLAGPPLRWVADDIGWRTAIALTGGIGLVLAIAIGLWMRDSPSGPIRSAHATETARPHSVVRGLLEIWRYRNTALIFWANSGICGTFLTFTGLWGVPYLTQVHGISVQQASTITSTMLVLFALGGPAFGLLSDRLHRRKAPYLVGGLLMTLALCTLSVVPSASLFLLVPLLLAGAFGAGAMALSFVFAKESVPLRLQGTVTAAVNLGVMTGTLIQMPAIGAVLDAAWSGNIIAGVRQYGVEAFRLALIALTAWIIIATGLLALTRETHARQLSH